MPSQRFYHSEVLKGIYVCHEDTQDYTRHDWLNAIGLWRVLAMNAGAAIALSHHYTPDKMSDKECAIAARKVTMGILHELELMSWMNPGHSEDNLVYVLLKLEQHFEMFANTRKCKDEEMRHIGAKGILDHVQTKRTLSEVLKGSQD